MKNQNKIIAVVFFAIAALMSAMEFLYVADRYPIGFFSALLAFEILLTFTASAVFIVGTAIKSRTVLITAEGIFAGAAGISLISAVMRSGAMIGHDIALLAHGPVSAAALTAMVIMIIYTTGALKNKYVPASLMTLALVAQLCRAALGGTAFSATVYVTEALIFSALTVMALYPDISGKRQVKTAEMLWLSFATFGVYLAVWAASIVKKMAALAGKSDCMAKAVMFILFSPYRIYWYYTTYEEQETFKNRGIFLSAVSAFGTALSAVTALSGMPEASLSGFGVSIVALALIQRDLNSLVTEEVNAAPAEAETEAAEPETDE